MTTTGNGMFMKSGITNKRKIRNQRQVYIDHQGGFKVFQCGQKKLRRMCEDHLGSFAVYEGNRYLVIRPRLEAFFLNGGTEREKELQKEMLEAMQEAMTKSSPEEKTM